MKTQGLSKEPDKSKWRTNYNNKSLSGIEFRDKDGELVNFIIIRHDEILKDNAPHRITIKLNENSEPLLPRSQTFEEMIQAKRRYQMLLYGSGNHSASSSSTAPPTSAPVLSDRQARKATSSRPKEVKLLLKSAAPGSSITLPNGTVIKKSRRGGARIGAGRKRSRPLPSTSQTSNSSTPSRASTGTQNSTSSNSSSLSQT